MSNYKFILASFLLLCICISCQKKYKLEGDKAIFIGRWNWIYSEGTTNYCDPPVQQITRTPTTENANYSIEFFEKGMLFLYKDNSIVNEYRITDFQLGGPYWCPSEEYTYFGTQLQMKKNEAGLDGCICGDTIAVQRNFPFPDNECQYFDNYFIRE